MKEELRHESCSVGSRVNRKANCQRAGRSRRTVNGCGGGEPTACAGNAPPELRPRHRCVRHRCLRTRLRELLQRHPQLTRDSCWQELRAQGFGRSYKQSWSRVRACGHGRPRLH